MAKRALLIGSQTFGLSGVDADIRNMNAALESLGFATRRINGPEASRDGIMDSYARLTADTKSGDAAAVYYSGHGGLAPNPEYQPLQATGAAEPRWFQFIVPTDLAQSTQDDFRGITDLELSGLLKSLTDKTDNVTIILDCCHSARMSRDILMTPRALPRPWLVGTAAHIDQLRARGISFDALADESNPVAVRVVACGPLESAFEYRAPNGEQRGLLTESLVIALEESRGLRVSWTTIGQRVRGRVLELAPTQRPEVEGPSSRLPFEVSTLEETGLVAVDPAGPALQGGRLLGIEVGDEYEILVPGPGGGRRDHAIGTARVLRVTGARADVKLSYGPGQSSVPSGAQAKPLRKALHRYPVRVRGGGEPAEALKNGINTSTYLRLTSGDEDDQADVLAEVEVVDLTIQLKDRDGATIVKPSPADDRGTRTAIQNLTALARAQLVLELPSGAGSNALDIPFTLEWGRVEAGRPQQLAREGELMFAGDRIYVRIANKSAGKDAVYVSIFDVGLSGRVTLLTLSEPAGILVRPGEDYVLGSDRTGRLTGLNLSWPESLPTTARRSETLVAFVSDRPQDLRALEQRGVRSTGPTSPLQRLLTQLGTGGSREVDVPAADDQDVRYAIEHITFLVDPNPAPARDVGTFLIDERPDLSLVFRTARGLPVRPQNVAIRLSDLTVYRNRTLFGSQLKADIRLDTVVITAPTQQSASAYKMDTARFPGIKNGDRLPFDNLLIFNGPVGGFVDIGIWVSRDQEHVASLPELIQKELNSDEFKTAALTLAGLAVAAPQAALIVGALGASATICNITYRLLSAAIGSSIGLYRTSLLAQEDFGVGRHPLSGTLRVQDFSFGYEILAV